MFLESGSAIADKIRHVVDQEVSQPVKFAVAFWGAKANYQLRGACKIICDLESGACNPSVIRSLLARDNCVVLQRTGLHAKVVIGSAGAVVSSANMSTNGLGAEGADASGSIEAGYFVAPSGQDYQRIVNWFDTQWSEASTISEADLIAAENRWAFRNRPMPALTVEKQEVATSYAVDPFSLLEEQIDKKDRLRSVKTTVFNVLKGELPEVEHRRLGKIASWACHLLLNRAGMVQDYSAADGEPRGLATDAWIVSRFGTQKRSETVASVVILLGAISRSTSFSRDVRMCAEQALQLRPWEQA